MAILRLMLLAPLRAVADPSFCRDAARRSGGWLAGYLAYLALVFAIASVCALRLRAGPLIRDTAQWAAAEMPRLVLSSGALSGPRPGPVELRHPRIKTLALVVHPGRSAAVAPEEMDEKGLVAYLTRDAVYVRSRPGRVDAHRFPRYEREVALDADFYRAAGAALPKLLYPAAFLAVWLVFLAWKLTAAWFYSLLAAAINAAVDGGLGYGELWKLALVAQTPVVFLQIAHLYLPAPIPYFGLIALLVVAAYLWQALREGHATVRSATRNVGQADPE